MASGDPGKNQIVGLVKQASQTGKLPDLPSRDRQPLTIDQVVSRPHDSPWHSGEMLRMNHTAQLRTRKSLQGTRETAS